MIIIQDSKLKIENLKLNLDSRKTKKSFLKNTITNSLRKITI